MWPWLSHLTSLCHLSAAKWGSYQDLLQWVLDVKKQTEPLKSKQRSATGGDIKAVPVWPGLTLWRENYLVMFILVSSPH